MEKKNDPILAAREILKIVPKEYFAKYDFLEFFQSFENQTDYFPKGEVRDTYSKDCLKTLDTEEFQFLADFYKPLIENSELLLQYCDAKIEE